MKQLLSTLILFALLSCSNEKTLQLPEITNSDTNKVLDVSPAYIFYDETKKDSIELNRKNLISTTNWLVNVDKRLTLKQAIPQIKFLQEKKESSSHKKEGVKNYFTCNNTSIKNLGFIEFTDVVYHLNSSKSDAQSFAIKKAPTLLLEYRKNNSILAFDLFGGNINEIGLFNPKEIELESYYEIILMFDKELSIQDYIGFISETKNLLPKLVTIHNNEFIY